MRGKKILAGMGILVVIILAIVVMEKLAQPEAPTDSEPSDEYMAQPSPNSRQMPEPQDNTTPTLTPQQGITIPPPYEGIYRNTTLEEVENRNFTKKPAETGIDQKVLEGVELMDWQEVTVTLSARDYDVLWAVIRSLNSSEFQLEHVSLVSGDWFSGMITQKGIEKLRQNPYVQYIHAPSIGGVEIS